MLFLDYYFLVVVGTLFEIFKELEFLSFALFSNGFVY
jgi:hypothetical protein